MLRKFTVLFLVMVISVGTVTVSATENQMNISEDFGYVIEDGVERKIRFVSEEEYYTDQTSDFLIIDGSNSDKYINDRDPELSLNSTGKNVLFFIGSVMAGKLIDEVWIFIGGSAITQAMFAKAVATVTASGFNPMMIIVMGIMLVSLTSSSAKTPTFTNRGGCIWSGMDPYTGQWMCPLKV